VKQRKKGKIMLSVRLPQDFDKRLDILSKKTGRTKTYYVREAIIEHLEHLEDVFLALDRLEKPVKRWSLEELDKEIDLDN
jgi:RHH-type transcriptional regulator, rel operon repressor / antitoxin RelB